MYFNNDSIVQHLYYARLEASDIHLYYAGFNTICTVQKWIEFEQ